MLSANPEHREVLSEVLTEFKEVFPAALPFGVPPDRGLGDVHRINISEGAQPIAKKAYRHGPKEQELVKQ